MPAATWLGRQRQWSGRAHGPLACPQKRDVSNKGWFRSGASTARRGSGTGSVSGNWRSTSEGNCASAIGPPTVNSDLVDSALVERGGMSSAVSSSPLRYLLCGSEA